MADLRQHEATRGLRAPDRPEQPRRSFADVLALIAVLLLSAPLLILWLSFLVRLWGWVMP